MAEWQPESQCWDNFSYIFLYFFLLHMQPLRLTPGSMSKVRCHLHVSVLSLALTSSGMLLV